MFKWMAICLALVSLSVQHISFATRKQNVEEYPSSFHKSMEHLSAAESMAQRQSVETDIESENMQMASSVEVLDEDPDYGSGEFPAMRKLDQSQTQPPQNIPQIQYKEEIARQRHFANHKRPFLSAEDLETHFTGSEEQLHEDKDSGYLSESGKDFADDSYRIAVVSTWEEAASVLEIPNEFDGTPESWKHIPSRSGLAKALECVGGNLCKACNKYSLLPSGYPLCCFKCGVFPVIDLTADGKKYCYCLYD